MTSDFDAIFTYSVYPDESGIKPCWNIWAATLGDLINQGQIKATLEKKMTCPVLLIRFTPIWIYGSLYIFEGGESIFDIITALTCLGDLEKPG